MTLEQILTEHVGTEGYPDDCTADLRRLRPRSDRGWIERIVAMSPRALLRCGLAACVMAAVAVGSSNALAATRTARNPETPPGYHRVTVKNAGFSVALPDTWLALDPRSKTLAVDMSRAATANPKLEPLLRQFSAISSSIRLFAADQTNTTFSSNLLVLPIPIDTSELSHPRDVQTVLNSVLQGHVVGLETHKTRIAGASALVSTGTLSALGTNGTPFTVHATIYLVSTKHGVMDFDFSTPDSARDDATLQAIVDHIKLLP
jgi:hypothetical protein